MFKKKHEKAHTLHLKVPLACCDWCRIQAEDASKRASGLERRIGELEERLDFDLEMQFGKMMFDCAMRLYGDTIKSWAKRGFFTADPETLTRMFAASFRVVEESVNSDRGGFSRANLATRWEERENSPLGVDDMTARVGRGRDGLARTGVGRPRI